MGPLDGLKVLELEAIGPAPFCGMMLADLGADVLLIDRPDDPQLGFGRDRRFEVMLRGRRSIALDLKTRAGREAARTLAGRADVLIEGFRPGVLERLGLGPDRLLADNPRLVIGRMTGWGQDGPLSPRAGHDIDYIALSGVLDAIGRADGPPVPPLNLVGDFGGGGLLLAFGIVCAVLEARTSGRGQVVDAAMIDGASVLATMFAGMTAAGQWHEGRGTNVLDSGAPWYDSYRTADDRYIAVGAIEPKFYAQLLTGLGLDPATLPDQDDRGGWPRLRAAFTAAFATRSRDDWVAIFAATDACVAPVLTFAEARAHPHLVARRTWVSVDGIDQPAPAPRFSRTPGAVPAAAPARGRGGIDALARWGFTTDEIAGLHRAAASPDGASRPD